MLPVEQHYSVTFQISRKADFILRENFYSQKQLISARHPRGAIKMKVEDRVRQYTEVLL